MTATGSRLRGWLKRDWLPLLGFALATVLMTYPLILHLGDGWLPYLSNDLFMKVWDIWWLDRVVGGTSLPGYASELFYPLGLDMTYHSISWTFSALAWLFVPMAGVAGAFKLTVLVSIFTTAYSAYLLGYWLLKDRSAAWIAGAIYGFAPNYIAHSWSHAEVTLLAPIPLTVLLLSQGITRGSLLASVAAGLMFGLVGWTGLYIFGFATITLVPVTLYLALDKRRWRERRFWYLLAAFVAASALVLLPRLLPIANSTDLLAYVIDNKYQPYAQTDLLSYLIPSTYHPVFRPLVADVASRFGHNATLPQYLGLAPVALSLSALFAYRDRRTKLLWAGIGLVFLVLSAGVFLRFNGQMYEHIRLPASLLEPITLFRTVRPHWYHIGLLLPLAILSAYGFNHWATASAGNRAVHTLFLLLVPALLLFEYWNGFSPMQRISASPIYSQIAAEEGEFAVIDLPMGYHESKYYLYLQTLHQRPIVEGATGRMPGDAYRYIEQNALLSLWVNASELECSAIQNDTLQAAIDQMVADGFRYVLVHDPALNWPLTYFTTIGLAYGDETLRVYALSDLQANPPCEFRVSPLTGQDAAPFLAIAATDGSLPCGIFDVRGMGSKEVSLSQFPACFTEHGTPSILCLSAEGQWSAANVRDMIFDRENALLSFTSGQHGHCAIFPPVR